MTWTKAKTYSRMLTLQADMAYEFEKPYFRRSSSWFDAHKVFDLGTGNGHYLRKLKADYPNKLYMGLEADKDMFDVAISLQLDKQLEIQSGTIDNISDNYKFDYMLARIVFCHIANREEVYKWMSQHANSGAGVLITDADDTALQISPKLPEFEKAVNDLRAASTNKGSQRNLQHIIPLELKSHGFEHCWDNNTVIHSDFAPGFKEKIFL